MTADKSMWIILAVPYICMVFYENYFIDFTKNNSLVDYKTLPVKDLRTVLDRRGLLYNHFQEEKELVNLLEESGHLTVGELNKAIYETAHPASNYKIDKLVVEIDLTNVSPDFLKPERNIWLIHVEPEYGPKTVEMSMWRGLIRTLHPFNVSFGWFECEIAPDYCKQKGWNTPTIVLLKPRMKNRLEPETGSSIPVVSFPSQSGEILSEPTSVFDMTVPSEITVCQQAVCDFGSMLKQVYDLTQDLVSHLPTQEAFNDWEADEKCTEYLILLTHLRQCPFLLSALAAKFNDGEHCFAFGPRAIIDSLSIKLQVNQSDPVAFYAFKSKGIWQLLVPSINSTDNEEHRLSEAKVLTFDNFASDLFNKILINDKLVKRMSYNPIYYLKIANIVLAFLFSIPLLVQLLIYCVDNVGNTDARHQREFEQYVDNRERPSAPTFQSQRQQTKSNQRWQNEEAYYSRRNATSNVYPHPNINREIELQSNDWNALLIRLQHRTDWHKQIIVYCNIDQYISLDLWRKLDEYGISLDEIGFPPYNWILQLPRFANVNDYKYDGVLSPCPICQTTVYADRYSRDNFLCRLPCDCKNIVYHFDCIAPWLIKRDVSSHRYLFGKLYTVRPCPTCRSDLTNWGLSVFA